MDPKARLVVRAAAPRVGRTTRPVVRATIRQGWLWSRDIQHMVQSLREDLEDVTAEALLGLEGSPSTHQSTTRPDGDTHQQH